MAKKHHEEEHENAERWLVSYADFITLLFAFFTVLYATAQKDVKKEEEFQKSIRTYFKSFVDFGGLMGKFGVRGDSPSMIPPPIDTVPQEGPGPEDKEEVTSAADAHKELGAGLAGDEDTVVTRDKSGVKVTIRAKSFFDSGTALLLRGALPILDKIAVTLKKVNRPVFIEGHTDDRPIQTQQYPSNWELSSARASTIVRYLVEIHKINPSLFAAVGYADQKPLLTNEDEYSRSRNRRIDILITDPPAETPKDVIETKKLPHPVEHPKAESPGTAEHLEKSTH